MSVRGFGEDRNLYSPRGDLRLLSVCLMNDDPGTTVERVERSKVKPNVSSSKWFKLNTSLYVECF